MRDPYRDWSLDDRHEAWENGDYYGCDKYDSDRESGDRAYENWRNGGDFEDPEPDSRFS